MRYLSLFSGIEAASAAWGSLGWECAAVAEVEPFPCAVLEHHYPGVPNLGDVTKVTEEQIKALGHIDLVVFGSPCQDLSVAGQRKGLINEHGDITRSGLFFTAINIFHWSGARFALWENVPGAFSSGKGRDFASVVSFMAGLDDIDVPPNGWGTEGAALGDNGLLEWSTLDAQWFGVAQRRRRVFALLDTGDWAGRPPILLEPEGLRGDSAPRRETGESVARDAETGTAFGGNNTRGKIEVATAVNAHGGPYGRLDFESETFVTHSLRGEGFDASEDGTGLGTPLVPVLPFDTTQITSPLNYSKPNYGDPCHPLAAGAHVPAVAYALQPRIARNGRGDMGDVVSALNAQSGEDGTGQGTPVVSIAHAETMPTMQTGSGNPSGHGARSGDTKDAYIVPVVTHSLRGEGFDASETGKGDAAPCVAVVDTLYNKGFTHGGNHASTQEANAGTLLRELQEAIGEEAFAQWGLGILDSLQSPEILRQALYGGGIRPATFSRSWVVYCALPRTESGSAWLLQSLREAGCQRCASHGWEPSKQLSVELGTYLSQLSQPGAQAERFLRDLWAADEGPGILREALSAIQEMGRSAHGQGQPTYGAMSVRRLTPEECEFLQGFPRGHTAIPYRNKPAADGPRYKALGNSMAVPVMRWIGIKIMEAVWC